jgi:hypothetical protein
MRLVADRDLAEFAGLAATADGRPGLFACLSGKGRPASRTPRTLPTTRPRDDVTSQEPQLGQYAEDAARLDDYPKVQAARLEQAFSL